MERYNWAELGGVLLHGSPPDPSVHFRGLMLSKLNGWRGLPGARGSNDSVPGEHGTYPADKVLRDERSMELKGAAVGDDPATASTLLEQLETACGDRIVQLRVSDDTGVWSRMVEIEAFQPAEDWNRPRVPFTIDMIAPDPVRYRDPVMVGPVGLPVRSGGLRLPERFPWNFGTSIVPVLTVVNGGTRPTFPIVTVTGAGSSLSVTCGPRRIEFGAWSGEFVIDNRERRAFLNGADVTRGLIRREWQEIPAGASWDLTYDVADADPATQMFATYQEGAW